MTLEQDRAKEIAVRMWGCIRDMTPGDLARVTGSPWSDQTFLGTGFFIYNLKGSAIKQMLLAAEITPEEAECIRDHNDCALCACMPEDTGCCGCPLEDCTDYDGLYQHAVMRCNSWVHCKDSLNYRKFVRACDDIVRCVKEW
jgi:hypothetical protein